MRGLHDFPLQSTCYPALYNETTRLPPDSLARYLCDTRVDEMSGLPLGAASLALHSILPVYDLERNALPDTSQLQEVYSQVEGSSFGVHVTGSTVERLDVPSFTKREPTHETEDTSAVLDGADVGGERGVGERSETAEEAAASGYSTETGQSEKPPISSYTMSDIDVMLELKLLPVAVETGGSLLYMEEDSASHEGYTRVRVTSGSSDIVGFSKLLKLMTKEIEVEDGSVVLYLSVDGFNNSAVDEGRQKMMDIAFNRQGPALNIQQDEIKSVRFPLHYVHDMDFVPALPLLGELPAITAWLERVSVDNVAWPDSRAREDVRNNGRCFLVGAGHPSSERRELEWRLSFSDPERRLAQSLTPNQRKVYKVVKLLHKCFLGEPKVLVTYHLKTLLFWELETCGIVNWHEENLFQHILSMLDRIERCLHAGDIPSYFQPKNNLLSHVSSDHVTQTLATVRQIRRQPLQHIYSVDDQLRFDFSSLAPLSRLHRPLREAVLAADTAAVPDALVLSLLQQVRTDIHRGVGVASRCVDLLHDAWQALQPPSGGPHPVHDDWVVFATAAAFSSMECDESAWVLTALEMTLANEKRELHFRQLTGEEREVLPLVAAGYARQDDRPTTDSRQMPLLSGVLEMAQQSGAIQQPPAEALLVPLRKAQLELLRDLKSHEQKAGIGVPPLLRAVKLAQMHISMTDLFRKRHILNGVSEEEAAMNAKLRIMGKLPELCSPKEDLDITTTVLEGINDSLGPANVSISHSVMSELISTTSTLNQRLRPAAQQPDQETTPTDPLLTSIIPMNLALSYINLIGPGPSEEEKDIRYTAFFNMIGFFLKYRWYQPACRMVARLTCCGLATLATEQQNMLYDLRRSQLYLHNIPHHVQRLLAIVSGRGCIGVVLHFISFVNMMLARELMSSLLEPDDLKDMELMASREDGFPQDVALTHQVMRLCALYILGNNTDKCEDDIQRIAPHEVAQQIGHALQEWKLSDNDKS